MWGDCLDNVTVTSHYRYIIYDRFISVTFVVFDSSRCIVVVVVVVVCCIAIHLFGVDRSIVEVYQHCSIVLK